MDASPSIPAAPGPSFVSSAPSRSWNNLWLLLLFGLLLGALTWFAYSNSFGTGLTLDSGVLVGADPRITAFNRESLELIVKKTVWWPTYESDIYRPLTTFSYLVNYTLLGNEQRPFGYHVVNFLLHWANAWLVMVVLRRMTGNLAVALLAAALFAVHPVNTESVTNIVGRADLLATLSILLSGWCYLRAADARGWRKLLWLGGTAFNACWGFYAKENAVMIGVFVLLFDWLWRWPKLPGSFGARLLTAAKEFGLKGWSALIPAVIVVATTRYILYLHTPVFGQVFVDNPIVGADSWLQAKMTAVKVLGRYLALLVFPRTLSADYSYNQIPLYGTGGEWEDFLSWLSLAAIILLLWTAFRLRRTQPLYTWGVFFFFLTILPTANLLFPIGSIMGERFLYLPSIGFCAVAAQALLAAGTAVARPLLRNAAWRPGAAWALPAVVILLFAGRAHARNYDWQDNLSLWKSAREAAPESFKAWKGVGSSLISGRPSEETLNAAIANARVALAILSSRSIPPEYQDETVFIDLGKYYFAKGQYLELRHDTPGARHYFGQSASVLERAREVDRRVNQNSRAARVAKGQRPEDVPDVGNYHIYEWLGRAYERLGETRASGEAGRHIQRLQPQLALGYQIAGVAAYNSGDFNEAVLQFLQALFLEHNNAEFWRNLSQAYARLGVNPNPVSLTPNGPGLDDNVPLVRQQINAAGLQLVRNFETAKQFDSAEIIRKNLLQSLHIPPEVFDKK